MPPARSNQGSSVSEFIFVFQICWQLNNKLIFQFQNSLSILPAILQLKQSFSGAQQGAQQGSYQQGAAQQPQIIKVIHVSQAAPQQQHQQYYSAPQPVSRASMKCCHKTLNRTKFTYDNNIFFFFRLLVIQLWTKQSIPSTRRSTWISKYCIYIFISKQT